MPTEAPAGARARRERPALAAAAGLVALAGVALALPNVLASWRFTPDAIGYVATAHDWLSGRGWVDPVMYSYFLEDVSPPVPAFAVRPPVLSLLLAAPLALGAGLTQLSVLHVLWASAIGASGVFVARRVASGFAAVAFAVLVTGSIAWTLAAEQLLTEATSVGLVLAFLASVERGLSSVLGALGLAALLCAAYFTRPNLGILLPAAGLAALCRLGWRGALRSAPLWTFVAGFLALRAVAAFAIERATGVAPYAHYGLMAETVDASDSPLYQREYAGWLAYLRESSGLVLSALRENLRLFGEAAFTEGTYLRAGWLAPVAIAVALVRPGPHALAMRTTAFAALGFTAASLATYGGFDVLRYPLQGLVCAQLANVALVDRLVARRRGLRALPLVLALGLFAVDSAPTLVPRAHGALERYRASGTTRVSHEWDVFARSIGELVDRDAILASPDPWRVHLWTGMAGLWIPPDLDELAVLHRYLDEETPGYLATDGAPERALLEASPRLERVIAEGDRGLYRVLDAPPASRPWSAPPPLASLGER